VLLQLLLATAGLWDAIIAITMSTGIKIDRTPRRRAFAR